MSLAVESTDPAQDRATSPRGAPRVTKPAPGASGVKRQARWVASAQRAVDEAGVDDAARRVGDPHVGAAADEPEAGGVRTAGEHLGDLAPAALDPLSSNLGVAGGVADAGGRGGHPPPLVVRASTWSSCRGTRAGPPSAASAVGEHPDASPSRRRRTPLHVRALRDLRADHLVALGEERIRTMAGLPERGLQRGPEAARPSRARRRRPGDGRPPGARRARAAGRAAPPPTAAARSTPSAPPRRPRAARPSTSPTATRSRRRRRSRRRPRRAPRRAR